MDPQQEVFTSMKILIEQKGYAVYDGSLPPEGTPYPFVYMGTFQQVDRMLKNGAVCNVFGVINVYSNEPDKRGTLSNILTDIKRCARFVEGYELVNSDTVILDDNTTNEPLVHGVVNLKFMY